MPTPEDLDWLNGAKPQAAKPRSSWERFKDSYILGAMDSAFGAEPVARGILKLQGYDDEEINQGSRRLRDRIQGRQAKDIEAFDKQGTVASKIDRYGMDIVGGVSGGINPTDAIGLGKSVLQRMGVQGLIGGGTDAASQAQQLDRGIIDELDEDRLAMAAAGSTLLQGAGEGAGAVGRSAVSTVKKARANRAIARGGDTSLDTAVSIGDRFGQITSTIRSAARNKKVGGAKNSHHLTGNAIDIARGKGVTHKQIESAYRRAGYDIVESLDEGDHSHFAFKFGKGKGERPGQPIIENFDFNPKDDVRLVRDELPSAEEMARVNDALAPEADAIRAMADDSDVIPFPGEKRAELTDDELRDLVERNIQDNTDPFDGLLTPAELRDMPAAERAKLMQELPPGPGTPSNDLPPVRKYDTSRFPMDEGEAQFAMPDNVYNAHERLRTGEDITPEQYDLIVDWFDNKRSAIVSKTGRGVKPFVNRSIPPARPAYPGEEGFPAPGTPGNMGGPKGGPDKDKYAGSVNLNRMYINKDAKDYLRNLSKTIGVDHQTHEQTKAAASKMIDDYGLDELLKRTDMPMEEIPAYNTAIRAINASASRRVVRLAKDVLHPEKNTDKTRVEFDEARILAAAAYERANGISGMAGRILDAQNIVVGRGNTNRSLGEMISQLSGNTLDSTDVAKMIAAHEGQVDKILADSMRPKAEDYFTSLWYNWRLSGLTTQAANTVGTASHLMLDFVNRLASMPLDAAISGKNRTTAAEISHRLYGLWVGAKQAVSQIEGHKKTPVGVAFDLGTPLDLRGKIEGGRTFKGKVTGLLELPTRTMAATDEFFRNVAVVSDLYGGAFRLAREEGLEGKAFNDRVLELTNNPTREMEDSAIEYGRRMRFADDASGITKKVEGLRHSKKGDDYLTRGIALGVRMILPFVHTLDRLTAAAVRHSPLGLADRINRADLKKGGSARSLAVTRMAVGTLITLFATMQALEGNLTGAGPSDWRKKEELQASGWRPYSVKIGDKYVSLRTLQPISTILGTAATGVEQWTTEAKDKSLTDKILRTAKGAGQAALSGSWTESLNQFFQSTGGGDNSRLASLVASMTDPTPSIVRQASQAYIDPSERDTTGDGSFASRVRDRWKSSIPGLSDDLPQKVDAYGRPIEREGAVGPDILSPLKVATEDQDAIVKEVTRLSGTSKSAVINPPRKEVTVDGEKRRLNSKEYQQYRQVSGEYFMEGMKELMVSDEYQLMSDDEKKAVIKKQLTAARKQARDDLFVSNPDLDWLNGG